MKKIVTGLDIGTTKVCAAIGEAVANADPEIRGIGIADAKGINKGFVSSLDKLVDSINKAVESAEDKAGIKAHNIVTNISGASVAGRMNEGLALLSRRGREITKRDVKKVIDITKKASLTMEKDFLYASPQEFIVDDNDGVEDAAGLFGARLKARLYVITAQATHLQNISKAVTYAGYELLDIIPVTVAVAPHMAPSEDNEGGTVLIDIGGGITELAIFSSGVLRFFDSINAGGMDLTSSLSAYFNIPFNSAEMIKKSHGGISKEDLSRERKSIFNIDNRQIVLEDSIINNLLKERFSEISHILKERLNASDYYKTPVSSLAMMGGGSLLSGAVESFEDFFKIPARMIPKPIHFAAISLARYGLDKYAKKESRITKGRALFSDSFYKLKDFFDEYF